MKIIPHLSVVSAQQTSSLALPVPFSPDAIPSRAYASHPLGPLLAGGESWRLGVSLATMLGFGNFGIGATAGLGAELIILGGVCFQATSPTTACPITQLVDAVSPFCLVTQFNEMSAYPVPLRTAAESYQDLQEIIGRNITDHSRSYAVRVSGRFRALKLQCVQPPKPGQKTFADLDQARGTLKDCDATLVGFKVGSDVDPRIHPPVYHFHAITKDGTGGGHVLDLAVDRGAIGIRIKPLAGIELLNS